MSILDEIARRRRASALRRLGPPPGALPEHFPGAPSASVARPAPVRVPSGAPAPARVPVPVGPTGRVALQEPPGPALLDAPGPVEPAHTLEDVLPQVLASISRLPDHPREAEDPDSPDADADPVLLLDPAVSRADDVAEVGPAVPETIAADSGEVHDGEVELDEVEEVWEFRAEDDDAEPASLSAWAEMADAWVEVAPDLPELAPEPEAEAPADLEIETEPEAVTGPEAVTEPEIVTELEAVTEPEWTVEPDREPESEWTVHPEREPEPERTVAPEREPEPDAEPQLILESEPITGVFPIVADAPVPPPPAEADPPQVRTWMPAPELLRLTEEPVTSTELVPVAKPSASPSRGLPLPGFVERTQLRRRIRYLRSLRELQLRDLGGFAVELHRFGRDRPELVRRKIESAAETVRELHQLEFALKGRVELREVREAGIGGACEHCGAVYGSEDRFCSNCGEPLPGTTQFGPEP